MVEATRAHLPHDEWAVVWTASLDNLDEWASTRFHLLSGAERDRADRYRFARDRRRFVASRLVLRTVLGEHLAQDPGRLELDTWCASCECDHAKPKVKAAERGFDFSMSRSGDLALVALGNIGPIGIDVEQVNQRPGVDQLIERVLTHRERAQIPAAGSQAREIEFLRWWTRKEAYTKAAGYGLYIPLPEIELVPAGEDWLVRRQGQPGSVGCVRDLDPAPGYVGAIATEGALLPQAQLAVRTFTCQT